MQAAAVTAVTDNRPVPLAGPYWGADRFWAFDTSPCADAHPSRMGLDDAAHVERYVMGVASIAECLKPGSEGFPYDVDEPLDDALPQGIDPETADQLAAWLAPAIDRATELLGLLERRAAEDWPDDDEA